MSTPEETIAFLRERVRVRTEEAAHLNARIESAEAELAYLRTVVTEKFARDIEVAVKPEDAADVAKWAANPEAVRELLSHTPRILEADLASTICPRCGRDVDAGDPHWPDCPVFLAWAALEDPRAAEAIGAAFDRARVPSLFPEWQRPALVAALVSGMQTESLIEAATQPFGVVRDVRVAIGGTQVNLSNSWDDAWWNAQPGLRVGDEVSAGPDGVVRPFRLASESEQAARERTGCTCPPTLPGFPRPAGVHSAHCATRGRMGVLLDGPIEAIESRNESDARGIEAVKAEALYEHLWRYRATLDRYREHPEAQPFLR